MQEQEPLKKHPVNYWVDEETENRLKRLSPIYGTRSHLARQALLKELDRLEQNTPEQEKIAS